MSELLSLINIQNSQTYKCYLTIYDNNLPMLVNYNNKKYKIGFTKNGGLIMTMIEKNEKKSDENVLSTRKALTD